MPQSPCSTRNRKVVQLGYAGLRNLFPAVGQLVSEGCPTCFRKLLNSKRKVAQLSGVKLLNFPPLSWATFHRWVGQLPAGRVTSSGREPRHHRRHRRRYRAIRARRACLPPSCSAKRNRLFAWRLSVRRPAGS